MHGIRVAVVPFIPDGDEPARAERVLQHGIHAAALVVFGVEMLGLETQGVFGGDLVREVGGDHVAAHHAGVTLQDFQVVGDVVVG